MNMKRFVHGDDDFLPRFAPYNDSNERCDKCSSSRRAIGVVFNLSVPEYILTF